MATQASDTTTNSTPGKKTRGASGDDLAVVAQRAQAFTNASGVAIALNEGNADEIVCRARSGASAPEIGAALRVEGTFTGLCIQSGKELRCDDCETDTRVDTAAIRALGIRSMVVTPIREESRVVGVLAAFAPTSHAFTITHVAVLKTMADQISAMLQKSRSARDDHPAAEIPRPAAPMIVAKPAPTPVAQPPVVIKSSASAAQAAAPAHAKVEPIRGTPVEVVPLAAATHFEKRMESAPRGNFGTFDSVANERKQSGGKFMLIGVVAVIVIAAAATFAFLKMQKPGSATSQHAEEAANTQPSQSSATATNNPQLATVANAPAAVPSVVVPASTSSLNSKAGEGETRKSSKGERASNSQSEKPAPAEKQQEIATLAVSGTSRIAQQSQEQESPQIAPSFSVDAGNAPAPLSNLTRPMAASTPKEAAVEQSQLEPIQLLRTAPLVYPSFARTRNITGIVVIQLTVDKNGSPTNLQFLSGPPIFKDAAFDAIKHYQFKPAKLNGLPVEQKTQVKLNFR